MARVDIEIGVDASEMTAALADIPPASKKAGKSIADEFGGASKRASASLGSLGKAGTSALGSLASGAGAAAGALGGVAAATMAVVAAHREMANSAALTNRELGELSVRTGLSTDTLNGLRLAASASGRELDDLVPSDLAVRIMEAASGTGTGADAFRALGVAAQETNGTLRKGDDVFRDVVDGLAAMEDRTLAAALADDLFSDAGTQLMFTLQGGTAELDRFVQQGQEFGLRTGPEAAKAAREWNAAQGAMNLAIEDSQQLMLDLGASVGLTAENYNEAALGLVYFNSLLGQGTKLATNTELALATARYDALQFWISLQEFEEVSPIMEDSAQSTDKFVESLRRGSGAAKDLAKDAWDAARAVQALDAKSRSYWAAWAEEERGDMIDDSFAPLTANLNATEATARQATEALEAMGERFNQHQEEQARARAEFQENFSVWHGAATAAANALTDVWVTAAGRRADAAADAASEAVAAEEGLQAELDRLNEQRRLTTDEAERAQLDNQIGYTNARLEAAREETKVAEEEALKQWRSHQAARYAAAALNVFAAASLAFATTPFPASIGTAAAAAAAAGAEVFAIATAKPPEFPLGLSPDHVPVGVQPGEGIVNRRGVGSLGTDAIERANRGEGVGGGGGVSVYLGRRQIRDAVRDLQKDRPGSRYGKGRQR